MENSLTKKEYSPEELLNDFLGIYGGEKDSVRIFASPARINIILRLLPKPYDLMKNL